MKTPAQSRPCIVCGCYFTGKGSQKTCSFPGCREELDNMREARRREVYRLKKGKKRITS